MDRDGWPQPERSGSSGSQVLHYIIRKAEGKGLLDW